MPESKQQIRSCLKEQARDKSIHNGGHVETEWNIYESEHMHMQETWNENKNSSAQTKPLKIKKK